MRLQNIRVNPANALDYLERQVNAGSPSGFTEKHTTSYFTNPFKVDSFNLHAIEDADEILNFGKQPQLLENNNMFYVHPDWRNHLSGDIRIIETDLRVVPTASARTVKVKNDSIYLKLGYPGLIGRMKRELDEKHISSAIQISQIFDRLTNSPNMPDTFAYLPEEGGRVYCKGDFKTGLLVRNAFPRGKRVNEIKYMLPAFSLFSKDRQNISNDPLIIQILKDKSNKAEFILEQLMIPLVDIYFTCSLCEGLNPEMHAQNLLIGFNENDDIVTLILRDLESVDKDVSIRNSLQKSQFVNEFKCIYETDYNYKIKHSFMFDHKLGEYFFGALLDCLKHYEDLCTEDIIADIKLYVHSKYKHVLKEYFPADGYWYKFENVDIDRSTKLRPYIQMKNSILR